MTRPFDFPRTRDFRFGIYLRQKGCCAGCCESLEHPQNAKLHHVIPNQSGDPKNPAHNFLRTDKNCVALCAECHEEFAHDGANYKYGGVEEPTEFRGSHGGDMKEHLDWVADIEKQRAIMKPAQEQNEADPAAPAESASFGTPEWRASLKAELETELAAPAQSEAKSIE